MRQFILAVALVIPAVALSAQTVTEGLRTMLALLPDPAGLAGAEISFGDMDAARALDLRAIDGASADPDLSQLRGLPPGPLASTLRNPATAWRGAAGFGLSDVEQVMTLFAPPASATLMRLRAGAAAAVPPALAASGYAEEIRLGVSAWARGEDMAVDIRGRDPDDPFGSGMGRSSRIQITGDLLRQGPSWPLLLALAQAETHPAIAQPDIAALVSALDDLPAASDGPGAGALVLATLYPDAAGLGLVDPLDVITGRAAPTTGVAIPWRAALFADLSTGARSTGVLAVSVSLPGTKAAEALRASVAQNWSERLSTMTGRSFAEMTGAPAEVAIRDAGAGLWVLRISARADTTIFAAGLTRNPVFRLLTDALMRRDLVFLQP